MDITRYENQNKLRIGFLKFRPRISRKPEVVLFLIVMLYVIFLYHCRNDCIYKIVRCNYTVSAKQKLTRVGFSGNGSTVLDKIFGAE